MARKHLTTGEFALFDVLYEDGTRSSNRKVPSSELRGLAGPPRCRPAGVTAPSLHELHRHLVGGSVGCRVRHSRHRERRVLDDLRLIDARSLERARYRGRALVSQLSIARRCTVRLAFNYDRRWLRIPDCSNDLIDDLLPFRRQLGGIDLEEYVELPRWRRRCRTGPE